MTGSVAVDVAIGLVFIFLIYSLLASIIQEIIATMFGMRARNLRHAIRRMLEDEDLYRKSLVNKNVFQKLINRIVRWYRRVIRKRDEGIVKEFYNQPIIKYLASNKIFSRPSYLNASDFSHALLEILKKNVNEENTSFSKLEKITAVLNEKSNTNLNGFDDAREHINSLLENAQGDLVKFRESLESWFNSTMQRAAGWYKRNIQITLLLIGFSLAAIFNVNTLEISNLLSTDKNSRDQMVALASSYIKENQELIDVYKEKSKNTKDTLVVNLTMKLDSLLKIKKELTIEAEKINKILGFRPVDSIPLKRVTSNMIKKEILIDSLLINESIIKNDTLVAVIQLSNSYMAKKTAKFYELEKVCIVKKDGKEYEEYYAKFNYLKYFFANFWGYFITALAISLGAPFWFDLLNKLIQLRNSIQNNSTNSSKSNVVTQRIDTPKRVG